MSKRACFIVGRDGCTVAEVDFEGRTHEFNLGVVADVSVQKLEPTHFDRKTGIVENFRRGRRWGRGK